MKRFFSDNLFLTFLIAAINYVFYIKNTCNNQIQILEDIYSAKYTVLTCFLGYFLHDFFVTTFWFTVSHGVVLFSGFLPLINLWYFIYIFSAIFCFTINYIFMKNLFGFSKNSKILNSIMFSVGLFTALPIMLVFLISKLQALAPGHEDKTKYVGCIFTIFPQMLLAALFRYKNIESIQAHTGDVKDNRIYVPSITYNSLIKLKPNSQFEVLGLDDASYSVVILIFVVSLLINFFGALYLFNKHVNAELRLKMK
ncbi:hypothetical protein NBO_7g0021 [Nosema bombycis CQ1]|uniref:Uncharacterized protein n=1 Tax=Nosema bombycis (strain CQ1 / CVCC 102059) TaxID=578461 RepID=R0MQN3_NOSB1|nr:hypothetical protein NBO_7g0021 [Nosema bombycis CQ1]|eukprot:EOB15203.1 hypothetical protein NBO_7g0021 [Nosema bombycis CQ1]